MHYLYTFVHGFIPACQSEKIQIWTSLRPKIKLNCKDVITSDGRHHVITTEIQIQPHYHVRWTSRRPNIQLHSSMGTFWYNNPCVHMQQSIIEIISQNRIVQNCIGTISIQSSAVITRSNIVRYNINNYRNWCRISIRCWDYKRHPIPRPNGRAMGCLLWIFVRKLTAL